MLLLVRPLQVQARVQLQSATRLKVSMSTQIAQSAAGCAAGTSLDAEDDCGRDLYRRSRRADIGSFRLSAGAAQVCQRLRIGGLTSCAWQA